jgi:hypothetical protein
MLMLWQKSPEDRMMPAEFVTGAIAVCTNALPQSLHLSDKLLSRHSADIFVHDVSR